MAKFCPIMSAGKFAYSLQAGKVTCSEECGLWDEEQKKCGLILNIKVNTNVDLSPKKE